jgi:hypothetical protein
MKQVENAKSLKELILEGIFWYKYLLSKWKFILMIALLGAILGLGYALLTKPKYNAKITFALEDKTSSGGGGIMSIASQFGFDLGGSNGGVFTGDNILELIKSRLLIEKTLLTTVNINGKDQKLINYYLNYTHLNKNWPKGPLLKNFSFDSTANESLRFQRDSILGDVYRTIFNDMLSVKKIDKKLSVVAVNFVAGDEKFSQLFVENLVENVASFYIDTKTGKSRKNVALLEHRVDSVKNELDAAMYGRAQFTDQNFGLVRQQAAVPKIKQEIRVQMLSTMYTELIKNLEFAKLALMREEPIIQIIDRPILPLDKQKLGKKMGVILGGMLFGFLSVLFIIMKKVISDIMNS